MARAYEGTKRKVAKAQQHEAAMQASQHCGEQGDRRACEAEPVCVADPIASWAIGRLIYNLRGHPAQRRPALRISLLTPGLDVLHEIENFRAGV